MYHSSEPESPPLSRASSEAGSVRSSRSSDQDSDADHTTSEESLEDRSDRQGETGTIDNNAIYEFIAGAKTQAHRTARRIVVVLCCGLIACPPGRHEEQRDPDDVPNVTTFPLRQTYQPPPDAARAFGKPWLEKFSTIGLKRGGAADSRPDSMYENRPADDFASEAQFKAAFSGVNSYSPSEAKIDIIRFDHERNKTVAPPSFDVDSQLKLFTELDAIDRLVQYNPIPQRSQVLTKSIHMHVMVDVFVKDKLVRKRTPVHQVTHILFAYVDNFPLYIFFPRIWTEWKKTAKKGHRRCLLTDRQYRTLYDKVTMPALRSLGQNVAHHVPPSFDAAVAASVAPQKEGQGNGAARGTRKEIDISARNLPLFWRAMKESLRVRYTDDGLWQFGDAFFLYDQMNTKLRDRYPSINQCLNKFWENNGELLSDPDAPQRDKEQHYIDIGAEFSCTSGVLPKDHWNVFGRSCCQANTMLFLFGTRENDVMDALGLEALAEEDDTETGSDGSDEDDVARSPPPGGRGRDGSIPGDDVADDMPVEDAFKIPRHPVTQYPNFNLRDICNMTCEPSPSSTTFVAGLCFIQVYTVIEELFLNTGQEPFSMCNIPDLVHTQGYWDMIVKKGNGKKSSDRKGLWTSYNASIHRMNQVVEKSDERPYGLRIEIRVEPSLANAIQLAEAEFYAEALKLADWGTPRATPDPTDAGDAPDVDMAEAPQPSDADVDMDEAPQPSDPSTARAILQKAAETFDFSDARNQQILRIAIPRQQGVAIIQVKTCRDFIYGNINKHVTLLDCILLSHGATSRQGFAPTPQGVWALFSLVLLSLRQFIVGLSPRIRWMLNAPFATKRTDTKPGIGLGDSRARRGFAFWPDGLVDWERLAIADRYLAEITVPWDTYNPAYLMSMEPRTQIEGIHFFLHQYALPTLNEREFTRTQDVIICFLLREYRRTVIGKLYDNIGKSQDAAKYRKDELPLTLQSLKEMAMRGKGRSISLVTGNKAKYKNPKEYFKLVWTDDVHSEGKENLLRDLAFRKCCDLAVQRCADSELPFADPAKFMRLLEHRFFQQHSATPYPDPSKGSLVSLTKTTQKKADRRLGVQTSAALAKYRVWAWSYPKRDRTPNLKQDLDASEITTLKDAESLFSDKPIYFPPEIYGPATQETLHNYIFRPPPVAS